MAAKTKKSKPKSEPEKNKVSAEEKERLLRVEKFIAHYSVHCNGAAAARFAGYSVDTARSQACRLLTNVDIQNAIREKRKEIGELHFDLANQTLAKRKLMLAADPASLISANGVIVPFDQWPDEERALISGFDVETKIDNPEDEGDPIMTRVTKVRFVSPLAVADSIDKVTGNVIERTQQIGADGKPFNPAAAAPASITIIVDGKKMDIKNDF